MYVVLIVVGLIAAVFKGSVVGGHNHLIVQTAAGEIGFYVFSGTAGWIAALSAATPGAPTWP
jgi:hypothetical protein